jgi:hypothetical protein
MSNTDGQRDITLAMEAELATVSKTTVAAAAKAAEDQDIAYVMTQQINCIIDANVRLRGSHRLVGADVQAWVNMVDYLTREKEGLTAKRQRQN